MKKIIILGLFFCVAQSTAQDMQKQFALIKDTLTSAQLGMSVVAQNSSMFEGISEKIPGMLSAPVESVIVQVNEALKTVQAGWFRDLVAKFTKLSDLEPFLLHMRDILQALVGQLKLLENELVICVGYADSKNKQVLFLVKESVVISDALKAALKAFDPMVKDISEVLTMLKTAGLL